MHTHVVRPAARACHVHVCLSRERRRALERRAQPPVRHAHARARARARAARRLLSDTYTSKSLMLAHALISFQTVNQLLMPLGFLVATQGGTPVEDTPRPYRP